MNWGIGTAQFGLDYGISNKNGIVSYDEVKSILDLAAETKLSYIDTSALYGVAEDRLGDYFASNAVSFNIINKSQDFKKTGISDATLNQLEQTCLQSLQKLHQKSFYGFLIHHGWDLLMPDGEKLLRKVLFLKEKGLVQKIGVSVYDGQEIDDVLKFGFIDIIQVPINILDHRLLQSGHLKKLKDRGVEVHARSVFLQGLLCMDFDRLPEYFQPVQKHLKKIREEAHALSSLKNESVMLEAALGFISSIDEIDVTFLGVTSKKELLEIIEAITMGRNKQKQWADLGARAAWDDIKILNPILWRNNA